MKQRNLLKRGLAADKEDEIEAIGNYDKRIKQAHSAGEEEAENELTGIRSDEKRHLRKVNHRKNLLRA